LITPDALPFEVPAILAHEWGHLAGYANESEASFVGWLTCMFGSEQSRYSGWLELIPRLIGDLPPAVRTKVSAKLAPGPRSDLQAIEQRLRRAVVPGLNEVAWAGYDRFLKANRVAGGVRSYDAVVTLLAGTSFDREWRPRLANRGGRGASAGAAR
jgi:Protein of unknown function (DUF3810)